MKKWIRLYSIQALIMIALVPAFDTAFENTNDEKVRMGILFVALIGSYFCAGLINLAILVLQLRLLEDVQAIKSIDDDIGL